MTMGELVRTERSDSPGTTGDRQAQTSLGLARGLQREGPTFIERKQECQICTAHNTQERCSNYVGEHAPESDLA